jgi:hypothetical protein
MAIQFSVAVRNGRLDIIEDVIGPGAVLQVRSGPKPATCAAADTGILLVEIELGENWMENAANGSKAMAGLPIDAAARAGGSPPGTAAGHYRIKDAGGVTHEQGTVTVDGGGGDITLDTTMIATDQSVQITSYVKTEGGA